MENNVLRVSIKDYKDAVKDLQTELLNLERGTDEYNKKAEELRQTQERLHDAMKGTDSSAKAIEGSYRAIQQEVSRLTKENKNLKNAFGENAEQFKANAQRIAELNNQLKEADAQMGYFNRNVGDYKNSFMSAFNEMSQGPVGFISGLKSLSKEMTGLQGRFGSFKGALKSGVQGIKELTVASLRFIATPIGATITALVIAFNMLKKGIAGSEENQNKFNKIMAKFQPMLDMCRRAMEDFADAVLKAIDPIVKLISDTKLLEASMSLALTPIKLVSGAISLIGDGLTVISNKIQPFLTSWDNLIKKLASSPLAQALGITNAVNEMNELKDINDSIANQQESLAKNERNAIVDNAKEEKKASELRQKAFDRESYNANQRKKYIQEYHKHQQNIIKTNLEIAKQQHNLAELEAKKSGNTAETNKQLAQQRAEIIKLEAALSDDTTMMEKEMKAINNEISEESKKNKDLYIKKLEWQKTLYEKRIENSKGNLKEDISNALKLEETEYQISKRKIENDVKDRQTRNGLIEQLEESHQKKLTQIQGRLNSETIKYHQDELAAYQEQIKYAHQYSAEYDYLSQKIVEIKESLQLMSGNAKLLDVLGIQYLDDDIDNVEKAIDKLFDWYAEKYKGNFIENLNNNLQQGIIDKDEFDKALASLDETTEKHLDKIKEGFKADYLKSDIGNLFDFLVDETEHYTLKVKEFFKENESAYADGKVSIEDLNYELEQFFENEGEYLLEIRNLFDEVTETDTDLYFNQLENYRKMIEEEKKESNLYYATLKKQAEENALNEKVIFDAKYSTTADYYNNASRIAFEYYQAVEARGKKYGEDEEVYQQRLLQVKKDWYDKLRTAEQKYREESDAAEEKAYEERVKRNLAVKGYNPYEIGDTELEEAKASYEVAQSMLDEALRKEFETEKEWQERILQLQKDAKDKQKRYQRERLNMMFDFADSIGNLTGSLGDYYMDEADRRREAAENNENLTNEEKKRELEAAKEAFERGKALQIATTTISTLAGASGAFMRAVETYPAPYGAILGGIESAAALVSGFNTIKQIEAMRFDGGGSKGALNSSQMATTFANAVPMIDEQSDMNQMDRESAVAENASKDQRVYILQSDISSSNKQVEVREKSSSFK